MANTQATPVQIGDVVVLFDNALPRKPWHQPDAPPNCLAVVRAIDGVHRGHQVVTLQLGISGRDLSAGQDGRATLMRQPTGATIKSVHSAITNPNRCGWLAIQ